MEIKIYQSPYGVEPFVEWLSSIRDKVTAARIRSRLRRVEENGNLGDYRSVGDGVFEFRLQFGAGYRVYFGSIADDAILLLRGGEKSSQSRDIEKAKADWKQHNSREYE
ncbi:MAG: type II toxin-antitoxin system RelE/ParE family toxin [Gemmatimonadota bacterium]|nr:type II toxin-antitoxin system RelE/ParE family toxin [Gemmatimonadota bacterium]